MSLPELVSFAVSGSAASAVSALVTDHVSPEERRGRPRRRRATPCTPQSKAARSAANGLIFFFTYYVAATAQYDHHGRGGASPTKSTCRAAADAFRTGATAFVFTRLFGSHAGPEQLAGHRWSLPALEDDALLALDPGLTFCVHEILARAVERLHASRKRPHGFNNSVVTAATTFLVAAASKAIATGLLYPLHVAAAEATERRWMAQDAEDEANVPLIILADDDKHDKSHKRARLSSRFGGGNNNSKRQHNVIVVLLQMLRTGGVRAVYGDWLRSVARAAFGHGLAMALQRSIYGYILQFILSLTGTRTRRAATRRAGGDTIDAHVLPPAHAASQARSARAATPFPKAPAPPPPQPTSEGGSKARNRVESWLELSADSKDALDASSVVSRDRPESSVMSKGTVEVDDSISNISSRASHPSQPSQRSQPSQTQKWQAEAHQRQAQSWQSRQSPQSQSQSWQSQSWQSQPSRQSWQSKSWQTQESRRRQPESRWPQPVQPQARQAQAYPRGPREVAGLVASRASAPSAFYPDAAAAGLGRRQWSPVQVQPPLSHDFDDDDSSLVFNMVSRSPRIIGGRGQ